MVGYESITCRAASSALDEAFKSSRSSVATWHYYSKRLILPGLGRHLNEHSDNVSRLGHSLGLHYSSVFSFCATLG